MRASFLKQYSKFLLLSALFAHVPGRRVGAQSLVDDIQQLIMDYEKLAQEKQILTDMYNGYQVVYQGYEQVKEIASGNFHLHQGF